MNSKILTINDINYLFNIKFTEIIHNYLFTNIDL